MIKSPGQIECPHKITKSVSLSQNSEGWDAVMTFSAPCCEETRCASSYWRSWDPARRAVIYVLHQQLMMLIGLSLEAGTAASWALSLPGLGMWTWIISCQLEGKLWSCSHIWKMSAKLCHIGKGQANSVPVQPSGPPALNFCRAAADWSCCGEIGCHVSVGPPIPRKII